MNSSERKPPQIFLSYASQDGSTARLIADRLKARGIHAGLHTRELSKGGSIRAEIADAIAGSDYVLALLSPHAVQSRWVEFELATALERELEDRGVVLLTALIEDCELPQLLKGKVWIDIRGDVVAGVEQLAAKLDGVSRLDFTKLDPRQFEELVADLLRVFGFDIVKTATQSAGARVDIEARYKATDPFGHEVFQSWLVETKLYLASRADVRAIHQLIGYGSAFPDHKLLLVTNGQLTSAARQWLESQSKQGPKVTVLEGPELKRMLLSRSDLLSKYFGEGR